MRITWPFAGMVVVVVALLTAVIVYDTMLDREARYYSPLKDSVVSFIASNHPDAAEFLDDLDQTYLGNGVFSGDGWYIEIDCRGLNCTATADFSVARTRNSTGIPHRILLSGTIINGSVAETSYSHAV